MEQHQYSSQSELQVKVGDKIQILEMDDNGGKDTQAPLYDGKVGIVERIDSAGQLWGTWGGVAVIPELDDFQIIQ